MKPVYLNAAMMKPIACRGAALALWVPFLLPCDAIGGDGKNVVDDCSAAGRKVSASIAKDAAAVLPIVGESLAANEDCTCEIVRAAILAVDSDPEMVRQIVMTALTAVQDRAAEIAECAVTIAPEAADAIKSALHSVLGDPESDPPPIGSVPVSIPGIFLVPPATASPANPSR